MIITIATINLLFGGESVGFLNPTKLRDRCERALDNNKARDSAMALMDQLDEAALSYNEATVAMINAYATRSADYSLPAKSLLEEWRPLDLQRQKALKEVIDIRQAMLEELTEEEWEDVLG